MSIPSYSSPYAVGHRAVAGLFDGPVLVQEKIDGSQFSFRAVLNELGEREVRCRSKGAQLFVDEPDKMFARGVESVLLKKNELNPDFIYRGEYLQKAKHNVLAYDRVPTGHVILFDIEDASKGEGFFLSAAELKAEAERLGFEAVPVIYEGLVASTGQIRAMLDRVSVLGGQQIEGVVIKNYAQFTPDKKVAMAKFVSEKFKEVHGGEWRAANPTRGDVVDLIVEAHRTPARFSKAVQHLREAGRITDTPKDIGPLAKEVQADVLRECKDGICDALFAHFWPEIQRRIIHGLPEWYKNELMEAALRAEPTEDLSAAPSSADGCRAP